MSLTTPSDEPAGAAHKDRKPATSQSAKSSLAAGREGRGLSRWFYYLASIPTILLGIRPFWSVFAIFLGATRRRPVTLEVSGGVRFRVLTRMEVWILKESCLDRDYERDAVKIQDGWTVVDIGAGIGDFAVRVGHANRSSHILAFEPHPDSFARMEENIRLNDVGNILLFPEGIAGRAGSLTLFAVTGLSGQHRTAGDPSAQAVEVRVPAITLEQALQRIPGGRCDFLKMDCEGAEYEILFAASRETLSRIRHMALEYHDGITAHDHEELVTFLEQRGFAVRTRQNAAYRDLGFLFASRRSA